MSKTNNKDFWNGPLTGSRIKSDDVKLPEMLIGYFIGPFGALLASDRGCKPDCRSAY